MKTSSASKNPERTTRQIAQGCLTANLAVPGLGSVVAGRKVGYAQMAVYFTGFLLTVIFGLRFVYWALANWSAFQTELHDPEASPLATLSDLWQRTHWALLGIALFAIAWPWALLTSRTLMAEAQKNHTPPVLTDEKI
jgi:H+/gluconate symporter-like permease